MDYRDSPYLIEVFDFDLLHMQLNTPLFILVLVLAVMFFMNRWLFRPLLETLERRQERVEALHRSVDTQRAEAERLAAQRARQLAAQQAELLAAQQAALRAATEEAARVQNAARKAAQRELEQSRLAIQADLQRAREQAPTLAAQLAQTMVRKLSRPAAS